jgi:putative DNA primase/helicase
MSGGSETETPENQRFASRLASSCSDSVHPKRWGNGGAADPPQKQTPGGGAGRALGTLEGARILQGQAYSRLSRNLQCITRALGGEVSGQSVVAPGPGHSRRDRSLSVTPDAGAPDGFLVYSHAGDDWRACRDHVRALLGAGGFEPARLPPLRVRTPIKDAVADKRQLALRIWGDARDAAGTLAERYLRSRGLELPQEAADVLRFHPSCPWGGERRPALVGLLRDIETNEPVGVHRTALAPDGAKIGRKMLGPVKGAVIKLDADEGVTMGLAIAEGVETALAGRQLGFLPVWAAVSAGGVAAFPLLSGVEALTIFGETDEANARAVEACRARWAGAGREVTINHPLIGSDLNDVRGRAAP